jgi:hypothetical protein
MPLKRRVYISMPADAGLSERQNRVKWGVVDRIRAAGYEPQVFVGPAGGMGLPAGKPWTLDGVEQTMRRCVGAALIGLPKFQAADGRLLATDLCQYEGAVAKSFDLPILVLREERVAERGVFHNAAFEIAQIPEGAGEDWLASKYFLGPFENWLAQVTTRRDVFLGYCGKSRGVASNIKRYLKDDLGVTVLDWQDDFPPAGSILENIQDAASRCTGGVFLFTKDDVLGEDAGAAPRDNVVFEAGYFAHAKGKEKTLIVLEKGAKMPADLGGDSYAYLEDRSNIEPLERLLRRFAEQRL